MAKVVLDGNPVEWNGVVCDIDKFAYDGCHKIYLIDSQEALVDAIDSGYDIMPVDNLQSVWDSSCQLRFINFWGHGIATIIPQFAYQGDMIEEFRESGSTEEELADVDDRILKIEVIR